MESKKDQNIIRYQCEKESWKLSKRNWKLRRRDMKKKLPSVLWNGINP